MAPKSKSGGAQNPSTAKSSGDVPAAGQSNLPTGDWWGSPVVHNGTPVVQIGREVAGGEVAYISMVKYGEERAFRFSFQHMHTAGFCQGYFYITPTRLIYTPEGHNQDAMNLLRSDGPAVYPGRYGTASFLIIAGRNLDFLPNWDHVVPAVTWKEFQKSDADKSHYKIYQHQVNDEVSHDDEVFRAWLWKAYQNFGEAEKNFKDLSVHAFLPLSAEQQSALTSEQAAGDSADQAGQLDSALQHYLTALQKLPTQWAPPDVVQQLQERIIKVVVNAKSHPAISEEAKRHYAYALAAIENSKASNDESKLDDAINQFDQTLRMAPWWPEAYFNRGIILETRGRYIESVKSLNLYLLAAPSASDAAGVQEKIYKLEYKAGSH